MKKTRLIISAGAVAALAFSSCKKEDTPLPEAISNENVVLSMITDVNNSSGVLIPFQELPQEDINPGNLSGLSFGSVRSAGYAYKDAIFENNNAAGDPGIQKLTVSPDGQLSDAGFIVNGVISAIKDDNVGYYWNPDLDNKSIQMFNPETMVRTGSIDISQDLSPFITDEVTNISMDWFMEVANDKLYTMVTFEDVNATPVYDSTFVAVINTNTNELEALTIHPEFFMFGYKIKNCKYTGLASDGYLYLAAWGGINFSIKSTIMRIKAGETTFDPNFKIELDEYVGGSAMMYGGSTYYNGKIYVRLKDTPVLPDFSNFNTVPDIYLYEIDVESKQATKIGGTPGSNHNSIHGPFVYNEKVYFPASNPDYQGYFEYDPTTGGDAKEVFTISSGVPSQIYILN